MAKAAATVSVSSPAQGQKFSGNDFTISGKATANSTVVLVSNGVTLKQTKADANGDWSTHLSGLPDGDFNLTVKSIVNSGYAYYSGTDDGGSTFKIHRLKLNDNTIDGDSYPYTSPVPGMLVVSSQTSKLLYQTGFLSASYGPAKFNPDSPAAPAEVPSYPDPSAALFGQFSPDDSKYFSPNNGIQTITVINTSTNTISDTINMGFTPGNIFKSPQDKLYVNARGGTSNETIAVINPSNNSIIKTYDAQCDSDIGVTSTSFSQDINYPYYYVYCPFGTDTSKIQVRKISDDSLVKTWNFDRALTNGTLNLDNSKMYASLTASLPGAHVSELAVIDTKTGAISSTISLTHAILGILQSPDAQHLYAGTLGTGFDQTGLDVIDTNNDTVQHLTAGGTVVGIIDASSSASEVSNVSIGVTLGVKTDTLGNTGAIAISSTILAGIVFGSFAYIYMDYKKHLKPLKEADPIVARQYTLLHHIKIVSIPLFKMRLQFSLQKEVSSDEFRKF